MNPRILVNLLLIYHNYFCNRVFALFSFSYPIKEEDKYSFIEDIKVVLLTIKTVLTKEGADAGKQTIQNEIEDLKTQKIPVDKIKKANKKNECNLKEKDSYSIA